MLGSLARFTKIDKNLDWFNSETLDAVDADNVKKISIPDGVHPNYVPIFFAFFEAQHMFVFETQGKGVSISPSMVIKYFQEILRSNFIINKYGSVDVNIVSDKNKLDEIIESKFIRKLTIKIMKPNPDVLRRQRERAMNRLNGNNAAIFEQVLIPHHGSVITPDEETRDLAAVALTDGEVVATIGGADGQRVQTVSTSDKPLVYPHVYESDELTEQLGFLRGARSLIEKIGRYLV